MVHKCFGIFNKETGEMWSNGSRRFFSKAGSAKSSWTSGQSRYSEERFDDAHEVRLLWASDGSHLKED